ncbi:uncharacterized protein LOC126268225 isoform X5 [Schistocerca gregaria]|uniref:uncharacterized protein LOC126268225 isoform X5 n=1 Tax=Schistocerca gregaria TaxID=7010 RepID=UPI00211E5DB5|nr:uncharacterized protein LOC126268225 isoform X5 [Schistocerca gregaria]
MEFYIRPPGGTVALYNMEKCIFQRFELLKLLNYNKSTDNVAFDCLIEGTALDKVGHHTLRLMSLSCLEFRDFFIEGETRFFLKRINTITENEAIGAIRRIRKHIADGLKFYAKSQKMLEILSVIDNTLTQLQTDTLLHAFSTNHREDCMEFAVHLPFTACLQLVRKRLVELSEGVARVPCGGWRRQLLPTLFATQLRAACSSAAERGCLQSVLSDERLKGILQKLSAWFQNRSVGLKQNILRANNVDAHAHLFPPCQDHTITANGEGGCPFVHFDHDRLRSCLSQKVTLNPQVLEEILSLSSEFPTVACIKHLTVSHLGNSVLSPHFTSPVQYYGCALKALKSKDNMNNML